MLLHWYFTLILCYDHVLFLGLDCSLVGTFPAGEGIRPPLSSTHIVSAAPYFYTLHSVVENQCQCCYCQWMALHHSNCHQCYHCINYILREMKKYDGDQYQLKTGLLRVWDPIFGPLVLGQFLTDRGEVERYQMRSGSIRSGLPPDLSQKHKIDQPRLHLAFFIDFYWASHQLFPFFGWSFSLSLFLTSHLTPPHSPLISTLMPALH